MTSKLKIITLSDIHLEKKSPEQSQFLLTLINENISEHLAAGLIPLVLLVGDIHNGIKSYEWMKNINAQVIYVAGNHEYWGGDFFEVNEQLLNNQPSNVKFLYNDAIIIEDTIFLGSTLWTDVGQATNPDILGHCAFTMNDTFYIKASQWYEVPQNITKLENLLGSRAQEFIEDKKWNVLLEIDENLKTRYFFSAFNAVHDLFTRVIPQEKSRLEYSLKSNYEKLSQPEFDQKMFNLLTYKSGITLKEYLQINNYFEKKYLPSEIKPELYDTNPASAFASKIFNQFKNERLEEKNVVVVSHHLPFMEETLIGHHRAYRNKNGSSIPPLLNEVNEKVYLNNSGENYPYHNYFWQCTKGEIKKDEDITKIAHYCNSGSKFFTQDFLSKIDVWAHGHEHMYNFIDYLKGIKIVCNPIGYALNGIKLKDNILEMTEDFIKKNPDNTMEKWATYVTDLKEEIIQNIDLPSLKDKKENNTDKIEVWSWYLWDKEKYLKDIKELLYINKKLSSLISKKIQGQKYDQYQINLHALAFNSLYDKISKEEDSLYKAIRVRGETDFSFQAEAFGRMEYRHNDIFSIDMTNSRKTENFNTRWIEEQFDVNPFTSNKTPNAYGFKESYFNSVHLTYANKKVSQIYELLKDHELSSPQDISENLILDFNKLIKNMPHKDSWKMGDKIQKRFYAVFESLEKKRNLKTPDPINENKFDF